MSKSREFILPVFAAVITAGVVGLGLGSAVSAQTTSGDYPPIIQKLVEKFNLNAEEVKQVFDENRQEMHEARLDKLVEEGAITTEQKTLLSAKHEEMRAEMDKIRDNESLTDEQRRKAMKELRESFEEWADDQGIELPRKGERSGGGPRSDFGFGPRM